MATHAPTRPRLSLTLRAGGRLLVLGIARLLAGVPLLSELEARGALSEVSACVQAAPGQAIAMPTDVVMPAGKPLDVEPAILSILADAGVIPVDPTLDTIRSGGVGVVVKAHRPDGEQRYHGPASRSGARMCSPRCASR